MKFVWAYLIIIYIYHQWGIKRIYFIIWEEVLSGKNHMRFLGSLFRGIAGSALGFRYPLKLRNLPGRINWNPNCTIYSAFYYRQNHADSPHSTCRCFRGSLKGIIFCDRFYRWRICQRTKVPAFMLGWMLSFSHSTLCMPYFWSWRLKLELRDISFQKIRLRTDDQSLLTFPILADLHLKPPPTLLRCQPLRSRQTHWA